MTKQDCTVTHNTQMNGIEIRFPAAPSRDVLNELKANKWRYSRRKNIWYNKFTDERMAYAEALCASGVAVMTSESRSKNPKEDAPATSMTFAQHLEVLDAIKRTEWDDKKEVVITTYMGEDGKVYVKRDGFDWDPHELKANKEKPSIGWLMIGKQGSRETFYIDSFKNSDLHTFGKGIYGIPSDDDPQWFYPANKDGYRKDMVNTKVQLANIKKLENAGFEVKKWGQRFNIKFKDKNPPVAQKVGVPKMTPIEVPTIIAVPKKFRKPHYDLPDVKDYKEEKAINTNILKREVLLGKMEVARHQVFNAYEDYYDYVAEKDLEWSKVGSFDELILSHYDTPRHIGKNRIQYGNYYFRYNGRNAKAIMKVGADNTDAEVASKTTKASNVLDADKFLKTAERLKAKAVKKEDELSGALNNTPKRMRQYKSKAIDVEYLKTKAKFYKAIGEAIQNDNLPESLYEISPAMSDDDLSPFMRKHGSNDYYDIHLKDELRFESYDEEKRVKFQKQYDDLLSILDPNFEKEQAEKKEKEKLKNLIDDFRFSKIKGFFPTPDSISQKMILAADIEEGMTVLEPSAGIGHLADMIKNAYPSVSIDVAERMSKAVQILKLKGYNVVGNDALEITGQYDRILMNPPYEKLQDIDHVRYAFENNLKPGGRLVALMSESPFFNKQKKAEAWREWYLDHLESEEQLEQGSFAGKDAFRQTGVDIRMIVLEKAANNVLVDESVEPTKQVEPMSEADRLRAEAEALKEKEGYNDYEAKLDDRRERYLEKSEKAKERSQETIVTEYPNLGLHLVCNVEENRVQFVFDDKPEVDTRTMLKGNGFRWSGKNQAWQRMGSCDNNQYYIDKVLDYLNENGSESPAENSVRDILDVNQKFDDRKTLLGKKITLHLPNGEERNAQFAIYEADRLTASHHEKTFADSAGYPLNKNGHNINDRNYTNDKNAQALVEKYARQLIPSLVINTSKTPSGTPIVDLDGVVVSGNNRTMSIKLAISDYPERYNAYLNELKAEWDSFGFDEPVTKLNRLKNPILVRIDYDITDLTTQELAKYNQQETKGKRPVDKAIELSNILMENEGCSVRIPTILSEYERMSDFYSNRSDQKAMMDMLVRCNLLTEQEVASYYDSNTGFTPTGKNFLEATLSAIILDKNAIMASDQPGVRKLRQVVITTLPTLMQNKGLQKGVLSDYINEAIKYQLELKSSGLQFTDYINQTTMFATTDFSKKAIYLNRIMNLGRNKFKKAIVGYNDSIASNQGATMFGPAPSSDDSFEYYVINLLKKERPTEHRLIEQFFANKPENMEAKAKEDHAQTIPKIVKDLPNVEKAKVTPEPNPEIQSNPKPEPIANPDLTWKKPIGQKKYDQLEKVNLVCDYRAEVVNEKMEIEIKSIANPGDTIIYNGDRHPVMVLTKGAAKKRCIKKVDESTRAAPAKPAKSSRSTLVPKAQKSEKKSQKPVKAKSVSKPKRVKVLAKTCSLKTANYAEQVANVTQFFTDHAADYHAGNTNQKILAIYKIKGEDSRVIFKIKTYLDGLRPFGRIGYFDFCLKSNKLTKAKKPAPSTYTKLVTDAKISKMYTTKGSDMYKGCLDLHKDLVQCSIHGKCTGEEAEKRKKVLANCGDLRHRKDISPVEVDNFHKLVKKERKKKETYNQAVKRVASDLRNQNK